MTKGEDDEVPMLPARSDRLRWAKEEGTVSPRRVWVAGIVMGLCSVISIYFLDTGDVVRIEFCIKMLWCLLH